MLTGVENEIQIKSKILGHYITSQSDRKMLFIRECEIWFLCLTHSTVKFLVYGQYREPFFAVTLLALGSAFVLFINRQLFKH